MKTVQVSRLALESIFEALDGSTAVLDLVATELCIRRERPENSASLYQLQTLVEMVDSKLLDQWEHIGRLLGRELPN